MKTSYLVPVGTITLTKVPAPVACVAALAGLGAGNIDNGNHGYKITFVTAIGETELGAASNIVTVVNNAVDGQIILTGIPIGPAGTHVIQRNIYRRKSPFPANYYFLATIADNTTTTYLDNTADAGLGNDSTLRVNTTSWIYSDSSKAGLLSDSNTIYGVGAGIGITSGYSNVLIGGHVASGITTGNGNTIVGHVAGYALTQGVINCAFGNTALYYLTTGGRNCAFGWWSLRADIANSNAAYGTATLSSTTSGTRNNAFGDSALFDNVTASYGNAFGVAALTNNTGSRNSAFGESSLGFNTSGASNTALGYASGLNNTIGSNNLYLGRDAGGAGTTNNLANTTCLGYNVQVTASNSCILGNGQNVGIGTTAPSTKLHLVGADNSTVHTITIDATTANVDASDTFVDFRSNQGSIGSIAGTAVPGVIAYNTFTGSHYTQVIDEDRPKLQPNILLEIVEGTPIFIERHDTIDEEYEEPEEIEAEKVKLEDTIKSKRIRPITVIIKDGKEEIINRKQIKKTRKVNRTHKADSKNQSQLFKTRICKTKGSEAAIGTYGGTDKEGRDLVLSIGTGPIWAANKGKDIKIGNYLESSDVEGCTELQFDNIYRSSTIAKATEPVIWNIGEIKRLIKCIYLGG